MEDEQLFKAIKEERTMDIRSIVGRGANVNSVDRHGCTPLHHASKRGPASMTRILLELGADPSAKSVKTGATPLHVASANNHITVGCILLNHGAKLTARDNAGHTPLSSSTSSFPAFAPAMIKHRRELDEFARENEKLIAIVGSRNHVKFEKLLVKHVARETASHVAAITVIEQRVGRLEWQQQQQNQQQRQNADEKVENDREPPATKRQKRTAEDTSVAYRHVTEQLLENHRAAMVEQLESQRAQMTKQLENQQAQLEEQRVEMAALRELFTKGRGTAWAATREADKELTVRDMMPKIKVEEETTQPDDDAETATTITAKNEKPHDRDVVLNAMERELQRVSAELQESQDREKQLHAELQTSQEKAQGYKMKLNEYKKKMDQLRRLTG